MVDGFAIVRASSYELTRVGVHMNSFHQRTRRIEQRTAAPVRARLQALLSGGAPSGTLAGALAGSIWIKRAKNQGGGRSGLSRLERDLSECDTNDARHLCNYRNQSLGMKKLSVLFVTLCVMLPGAAAIARGGHGGGAHHSSTGGAAGTSAGAPGTNSSGTALSSGGAGDGPQKGPLLGTNPAVDKEEAKVDQMIKSICRGC
jgi:hypothetical protein